MEAKITSTDPDAQQQSAVLLRHDMLFNPEYMPDITGLDPEKRNMLLIEKLLGLDMELLDSLGDSDAVPALSDVFYYPWLLESGTLEDLCSVLTGRRRDGSISPSPWKIAPGQLRSEAIQEQSGAAQQRTSYNFMHLFTSWDADFAKAVRANLSRVTQLLFHALDSGSSANLYHFGRIVESLQKALDYTFMDEIGSHPQLYLLPLVSLAEEPGVGDALIALLASKFANVKYRRSFYQKISSVQVFAKLCDRICSPNTHLRNAQALAEFLDKLIETVAPMDGSEEFFEEVVNSSDVIDRLAMVISSTGLEVCGAQVVDQRKQVCAEALSSFIHYTTHQFFETSQLTGMENLNSRELPNNFAMISDQLYALLLPHLVPIVTELASLENRASTSTTSTSIKFSCGVVPRCFTQSRYLLLEIVVGVIAMKPPEALDTVPLELWDLLVKLFIEFRFNNLYHILFFRLVLLCVKHANRRSLDRLFQHNHLLTCLIQRHTKAPSSPESGFVLLLANALRLSADENGNSGEVADVLAKCDLWKEFEPILRLKTETMARPIWPSKITDKAKPHFNPYPFNFGDLKRNRDDVKAPGIDLGSRYAAMLGFGGDPKVVASGLQVPSSGGHTRRSSSSSFISLHLSATEDDERPPCTTNVRNATVPGVQHDTPRPQLIPN